MRWLAAVLVGLGLWVGAAPVGTHGAPHFNKPVFGGPVSDWIHAFGKPSFGDSSGYDWLPEKCGTTTLHRLLVLTINKRVFHAIRVWCKTDSIPSPASRRADASRFFPAHTVSKGKINTDVGVLNVYFSRDIAPYFGDDIVQDCNGSPVKPGTFNMSAQGIAWTIDMGTCE